jgi:serine/threonine protein kinase
MPDRNSDSRYQLQGEIARGGMGAIIKGRDTDLGRDLAIKVLLDQHKDKPESFSGSSRKRRSAGSCSIRGSLRCMSWGNSPTGGRSSA